MNKRTSFKKENRLKIISLMMIMNSISRMNSWEMRMNNLMMNSLMKTIHKGKTIWSSLILKSSKRCSIR